MNENPLPTDITIDQGNLIRGVIKSWDKIHRNVSYLMHDNWVAYFKIWSRRNLHRYCGGAQKYGNQSDVFDSLKPSYVMLTFETKIHRLE